MNASFNLENHGRQTLLADPNCTQELCKTLGLPVTKENFHWIKVWEEDHIEPTFSDPKDFKYRRGIKGMRRRQPKWAGPIKPLPSKTRDECEDEDEWEYERDKLRIEYAYCLRCKKGVRAPRKMGNFKACPHCGYAPK